MIYFDEPTRERLVDKFYQFTTPNGYLFIGHSET
jgi:chemotaxis protein methyltransferase CheR